MDSIKCSIVRGGTSKGIFIEEKDLPTEKTLRDNIILDIFGSPDIRQIDGLGGADSLTSKVAIIGESTRKDADVDYTFGQVSITSKMVDYGGNCGNISSGVGVFAIEKGYVKAIEPVTMVKIHLTNSNRIITQWVPVEQGKVVQQGNYEIDGVPGSGAKLDLDWSDVVGSITGDLLPTGNPLDIIDINNKEYRVSVVDAGNIVIFVEAENFGITGIETPNKIDSKEGLLDEIELLRGTICTKLKLVDSWDKAKEITPYQPFIALVSRSQDYKCFTGVVVKKEEIDFVSRLVFMQKMHKTYPITGTVATAVLSKIKGSILWEMVDGSRRCKEKVDIGHPAGIISPEVKMSYKENNPYCEMVKVSRTARIIMDGIVYLKNRY